MAYKRKTIDEYEVQGNYGYGFETLITEDNFKAARENLKRYEANERGVSFKIVKRRVKCEKNSTM